MDDGGRLGLGTSTPVTDIHVKSGNTPTLRLEQDGSSGFTPQTWDVAGNETNFFIRDATNGSTLPIRLRPGAPTSTIDIAASGNIGIGTSSPGVVDSDNSSNAKIHVALGASDTVLAQVDQSTAQNLFTAENKGGAAKIRLIGESSSTDTTWSTNTGGGQGLNYRINNEGDAVEFTLAQNGNLTITGDYFSATCGAPCAPDYVFEPNYELMPLEDLSEFVKSKRHLPNIPSAEELVGPINVSKMQMKLLEKIEELTLYALDQHQVIQELEARLAALEKDRD